MARTMKIYACSRCNWYETVDGQSEYGKDCNYCNGKMYLYKTVTTSKVIICYRCPNCSYSIEEMHEYPRSINCEKCNTKMKVIDEVIHAGENVYPPHDPQKPSFTQFINNPPVECPYCKSINTEKISGLAKAGSVALFGIFSQKVKKQWKCKKCGSEF